MKVSFVRWCVDGNGRTPVAVEPSRVDCIEWFGDFHRSSHPDVIEDQLAATKIIMQGKQEYIVQGTVEEVTNALNGGAK